MHVCHVITRMILGGAMENTLLTCEGLHARGWEVTLVTGPALGPEGELLSRARAGGYRVIVLDDLRREIHPLRDWRTQRELTRLLRRLRCDLVHTHASKAGIVGRRAARRVGGMGIVHTIHGLPFHPYQSPWRNRLYVHLERSAARYTHALLTVADAMTRDALAAGIGRPQQYTTVYSGMDVERFVHRPPDTDAFRAALHLPPDAVLLTQIARLAELKGHDVLLDLLERIDDPRLVLCLVGDGALRGWIESEIARRGLRDRVRLTGLLPPERIPTALHATDILVHCSLREGLARTLPQGLLAGKPVVSFDVGGAAEVVDDATGALVPVGDLERLRHAVTALAADPALRDRLGATGRSRCIERFDHHRMVQRIEEAYRRVRP